MVMPYCSLEKCMTSFQVGFRWVCNRVVKLFAKSKILRYKTFMLNVFHRRGDKLKEILSSSEPYFHCCSARGSLIQKKFFQGITFWYFWLENRKRVYSAVARNFAGLHIEYFPFEMFGILCRPLIAYQSIWRCPDSVMWVCEHAANMT